MPKVFLISSWLLFILFQQLSAQQTDSLKQNKKAHEDSVLQEKHSPKKAALMSTVVPGLGQAYNKKYWKTPVIYAGFIGLGLALQSTQKQYITYRNAYAYRVDKDSTTVDQFVGKLSDEALNKEQGAYHHRRDQLAVGMIILYVLNIVDAAVDAHMFYFDVSDKLSLNVQPYLDNSIQSNRAVKGVALTLKF